MPKVDFFPHSDSAVSASPWENGLAKQILSMYADLALMRLQEEGVSLDDKTHHALRTQALNDVYESFMKDADMRAASNEIEMVSPAFTHMMKVTIEQRILQLLPSPQESWHRPVPIMHRELPLMPLGILCLLLISVAMISTAFAR